MAEDKAKKKDLRTQPDDAVEPDQALSLPDRSDELLGEKNIKHTCMELYSDVEKSFDDQSRRVNEQMDNWDLFNCRLTGRQFYNGNNKIFVPLVRDAINARVTRFTNQIFPQAGRHVEVTTEDGEIPHALMALLDYYIRFSKLRTEVVPAMLRAGDCEGQYTVYVSWQKVTRHVAWRASKQAKIGDLPSPAFQVEDILEESVVSEGPRVEVISDADLSVTPATANTLEEAIEHGGSVTVIRRWGKAKIQSLIDQGEIEEKEGKKLLKDLESSKDQTPQRRDTGKHMVDSAGIKKDARGKYALIYETWVKLSIPDEGRRLCRVYFAGRDRVLSVRRNPYWADRLPVISCPVYKVSGAFKGDAPVGAVADIQISANDAINQGMDAANYALCPIVMTDPEKNPRTGSMILSPAAIWETNPNDTQFAQFPPIWKDALELVENARKQIIQTLAINPASITQQTSKKKLNQAEIAQEQQIDILVTADAVTIIEEGILTPLLERFIELDHQFRDDVITVKEFGELGQRAKLDKIPPIQFHKKWQFRWFGVEQARSAQQVQQQISLLNVIRGIPGQYYPGYELDLTPALLVGIENTFGPRIAPLIFKDMRSKFAQDPQTENQYLEEGVKLPAHELDDHQQHMTVHAQALQNGDPHGLIREHMMHHQIIMNMAVQKQMQQMMGQQGGGQPGQKQGPQQQGSRSGGGAAAGPGMGGQVGGSRPAQGPPGVINIDKMIGTQAPRR